MNSDINTVDNIDNTNNVRKIKFFHEDVKIPVKKYCHDAGYDCYLIEDLTIAPYSHCKFPLGFGIQIKPGQMLTVRSRSSTKMRGVSCCQTTCDAGYTGQLYGFLVNHTNQQVKFFKGDRVVQLVFVQLSSSTTIIPGILDESDRSNKGFGSTGI